MGNYIHVIILPLPHQGNRIVGPPNYCFSQNESGYGVGLDAKTAG